MMYQTNYFAIFDAYVVISKVCDIGNRSPLYVNIIECGFLKSFK